MSLSIKSRRDAHDDRDGDADDLGRKMMVISERAMK